MFQRIHEKLGTAGFVIAIIALIAALSGGAYAASGGLNGKQKKEVEKIAKKFAGKPGANGTNGANGSPGAKGDTGATGLQGAQGPQGLQGLQGKQGIQGLPGEDGETGFTKFLPSGEEEKGAWSAFIDSHQEFFSPVVAPISFSIPLEPAAVATSKAFVFPKNATKEEKFGFNEETKKPGCVVGEPKCIATGCEGTLQEPTAAPGVLCVYTTEESLPIGNHISFSPFLRTEKLNQNGNFGFSESGAVITGITLEAEPTAFFAANGSWAVQAP